MDFKFHIATKVFFGRECIKENKAALMNLGKRAFIVTGKTSGRSSGALADIESLFKDMGTEYLIYDKIENNPSLENVKDGGQKASQFNADFVVGIGGGSPLDAAKAVAVLAVNDIDPLELYKNAFANKPLPIAAIPTTAGTGSEVTPYSILTRKDMQTKMSFGNEDIFPKVAFLDARYTENLPYNVTVNTAIDALSHAVEGYLSRRSMPLSDALAIEAIQVFGTCIDKLTNKNIDFETREKLLYASMLAGMVISHTGTTIVHGLGYSLTYFKGIPHGEANGLLMKEYLKYNYEAAREKINNIIKLLKLIDIDEFGTVINTLLETEVALSQEEINLYASQAMKQKSTSYNARKVSQEDMAFILKNSVG